MYWTYTLYVRSDFQPKLKRTDVVQSFSKQLSTLTHAREEYAEGIAKYPRCADQFSVNFTVTPNANISSISTDAVAQCNITNLERCKVYDIFARFYRGDQVLDTVLDVASIMTSKLGIANHRPCMVLETIHLNLIWRLGLPLRILWHRHNNSLTFCKYSMNKVLPRVFVQCKPTPVMSDMCTRVQITNCCCSAVICQSSIYVCMGYTYPCQEG